MITLGSDDCFLKGWDVRAPASQPSFTKRLYVTTCCISLLNSLLFFLLLLLLEKSNAGVTSIQFTPLREHVFAVGRY